MTKKKKWKKVKKKKKKKKETRKKCILFVLHVISLCFISALTLLLFARVRCKRFLDFRREQQNWYQLLIPRLQPALFVSYLEIKNV